MWKFIKDNGVLWGLAYIAAIAIIVAGIMNYV